MKYKTENEILEVITKFENGTIARDAWGHAEHLILAFHYVSNHDFETALGKMKTGLFKLLNAFEVDLIKEMPYHETLTVFWLKTVNDFAEARKDRTLVTTIDSMIKKFDKNYPAKFYTHEHLFSDRARAEFVEGDLSQSSVSRK